MQRLYEVMNEMKNFIPNYEARDEQKEMMERCYQSMIDSLKGAVHAPTGTGKSLGYLMPYIAVKLDHPDFKLVISTFTLNLQDQLKKDIELVNKVYRSIQEKTGVKKVKNLDFTILKGRANYLCEKRFNDAIDEVPLSLHNKVFARLEELKQSNSVTDKQNIGIKLSSAQWATMKVEACKKQECPFHQSCSFYKDYFHKDFDLVIVNHALFFNRDTFVKDAWDDYHFYIFDEAHKLEKSMLDVSTYELSASKMESWALQGRNLAYKYQFEKSKIDSWSSKFLFKSTTILKYKAGMNAIKTRITDKTATLAKLRFSEKSIEKMLIEIGNWLKEMANSFNEMEKEELLENEIYKEEKNQWMMSLLELKEFVDAFSKPENERLVWTEDFESEILLKVTPTDIKYIKTPFTKGVIFTSGTLAENGSCQPFANRLNVLLDNDMTLPTPFDLKNQTMVYASRDVNPKNSNYEDKLEEEIWELLKMGELKTFILFTSNATMERLYKRLLPKIKHYSDEKGINIQTWIQEKMNHHDIVSSFKDKDTKTILFGTLSYFEGIDLQGDTLTQVILTRLPFSVPTHPVQEILDSNENYSKWEALIRFEQAFGRLIRTKNDYGTFNVLDNRIYQEQHKNFFELFANEGIQITDNMNDVEEFYKNRHQ